MDDIFVYINNKVLRYDQHMDRIKENTRIRISHLLYEMNKRLILLEKQRNMIFQMKKWKL